MTADDDANELTETLARMSPGIADLLSRMMKWELLTLEDVRPLRDEIVRLNHTARTEEEQSALLFAFNALMDCAETLVLDSDALEKLKRLRKTDYRLMLSVQAMQGYLIQPHRLEAVTRREVEAARLAPDDDFRRFALKHATALREEHRSWFQRLLDRK